MTIEEQERHQAKDLLREVLLLNGCVKDIEVKLTEIKKEILELYRKLGEVLDAD